MNVLTGSILIILITGFLILMLFGFLNRRFLKNTCEFPRKPFLLYAVLSLVTSFFLVFGTALAIRSGSMNPGNIIKDYWFVLALISILCSIFTIMSYLAASHKKTKGADDRYSISRVCVIGVLVVLFCEIFIFNYQSFVPAAMNVQPMEFNLSDAHLEGDVSENNNAITIGENGGSIILDQINSPSVCFYISAAGSSKVGTISVEIMDENISQPFSVGKYPFFSSVPRTNVLPVYSSGNLKAVKFNFDTKFAGMNIFAISMNKTNFYFSYFRFLILAIFVLLIIFIIKKKWYRIIYNFKSKKHNIVILFLAVLMCLITIPLNQILCETKATANYLIEQAPGTATILYPLEQVPEKYGAYIQQFDAFQKGQLNLDLKVDSQLALLSNPYDKGVRGGISYNWDRAFYNGKYYSYFGVAPIFAVYYPFYFITGALPSNFTVGLILSLLIIPLIVLLIRELAMFFCKRINLLLLILGSAAVVFVSLIYMADVSTDLYYIPYMSAMLFFCIIALFSFKAYRMVPGAKQCTLLLFAGVAVAFLVGSRPTWAIYLSIIAPLFIKMLASSNSIRTKFAQVASFTFPAVVGIGLLLLYNYLRFNSIIEFGSTYQLTLTDMKYGTLTILNFLPSIYYYFLALPIFDSVFPFVHQNQLNLGAYHSFGYKMACPTIGALSFPLLWAIFFICKAPSFREKKINKAILLIMLGSVVFTALTDYSLAGTVIRYQLDITLVLALLAVILVLDTDWIYSIPSEGKKVIYTILVLVLGVSIIIGAALIFENERNFLQVLAPEKFANLQKLIMFW